ncbi:MAG: transporter [Phycisphaerales bacterium]
MAAILTLMPLTALRAQPPAPPTSGGPPMETDRPDFTEGTQTVPRGRVQLEGGYTFTRDRAGGVTVRDHTLPEALLRIGVVDRVEVRLGWEGYSWTRAGGGGGDDDGVLDGSLGFKARLLDQDGWVPDFAVIGEVSVPVGEEGKGTERFDPGVKLCWAYGLSERVGLAGNLNFAGVSGERHTRHLETSASLSLSFDVADHLGAYVEYFGVYPTERGRAEEHYFSPGLTFPIGPDLQFDIRAGVGLNDGAADLFAGAGFAVRW